VCAARLAGADPFANFKMTLRKVERIGLTETVLQTLVGAPEAENCYLGSD